MKRYSIFGILRNAIAYHDGWERAWRSPEPSSPLIKSAPSDSLVP